ncbi:MAG TPA: polyprenyl synthetase family protein [Candidatus Fournierella pullicola]|uniref:Farnesyl diphosphate synthase n=1 Tax=Candidatus Allofournierella pullicola TaxID=2838596 RepID=A0A9D1V3G2_9FIRM|nr:polyprenyl synthetase family protein [Candidatus Fournierella pullicola]
MNYRQRYDAYLQAFNEQLAACCDTYLPLGSQVNEAARYSLLAGGKRVRAVLCMAACELLGGSADQAARFACAVEMLHCYSLIHDDLPCMDNDDFRRGKPSCHKAFGEATALLAGDLLLTEAFEVIADAPVSETARVRASAALAHGAGSAGMVLGQELDLRYECQPVGEETLRLVHRNKTGALINAAVQMGASAAGGSKDDCSLLEQFAYDLGLVFQIVDDVLDVTSTSEELGKPIGSDAENNKTTFATLHGPQGAMELAQQINAEACGRLSRAYGERSEFLTALAESLLCRRT